MTRLLGISGSLRRGSHNTALLHAAKDSLAAETKFDIRTLHGIPLYDGDVETDAGIPASVSALKADIAAADGVLLATPEYNAGIPGVFKNAIDWLSRTSDGSAQVFDGKPVALIGAANGSGGTVRSQAAWQPVLKALKANVWTANRILVPKASAAFGENGLLKDAAAQDQLREFMRGFAAFAAQQKRSA